MKELMDSWTQFKADGFVFMMLNIFVIFMALCVQERLPDLRKRKESGDGKKIIVIVMMIFFRSCRRSKFADNNRYSISNSYSISNRRWRMPQGSNLVEITVTRI